MATRVVDFNRLPIKTRTRLIGTIQGATSPAPILASRTALGWSLVGWSILALLGFQGLYFLLHASYGEVRGYQPAQAIVGYTLSLFFLLLGVLHGIRRVMLARALPFAPGIYVFPLDCIEAKSKDVKITPMNSLVSLQPTHHYRNGIYVNTSFHLRFEDRSAVTFSIAGRARAEAALGELRASQERIRDAANRGEFDTIGALDPLIDARLADAWQSASPSEGGPTASPMPGWTRLATWLALAVGFAVAVPSWLVRNRLSDDAAFAAVKRSDVTEELRSYVEAGGRHEDEVLKDLLPRSALRDAQKLHTVAAVQAFLKEFPSSVVEADAQTALHDAYVSELEVAKNKGTVTALRDYIKAYPGNFLEKDAREAIHALFTKTLADFKRHAATDDPTMLPLIEHLMAYLEQHGSPSLAVIFHRKNAASLAVADKLLVKENDEPGRVATASQFFDDDHAAPRETAMVKALNQAFDDIFPADVLHMELAKDTADAAASSPQVDIDYAVGWSGDVYKGERSGTQFVGIKISFKVTMTVPDGHMMPEPSGHAGNAPVATKCPPKKNAPQDPSGAICPLTFALEVLPPDKFSVSSDLANSAFAGIAGLDEPSDGKVYDVMAVRAFDQVATKLEAVFFRDRPEPDKSGKKDPKGDDDSDKDDDDDNGPPPSKGTLL
jgi:hypothetical protein